MPEELKITEVKSFPTLFLGFDLRGMYDPDKVVADADEYVLPHGLLETDNPSDGSTYGQDGYLQSPHLSELRTLMQRCVDEYVDKIKLEPLGIWNSWMNKGSEGSKTSLHRHEGSVISGAFYPKIVGHNRNSPPLQLHSPLKPNHMCTVFTEPNDYNTYVQEVPAWEGMLWIFPSWCEHSTEVNRTTARYCLSFNTYPRKFEGLTLGENGHYNLPNVINVD